MRAMTVIPGEAGSAELTELPDPVPKDGELLVEPLYLGVCGTDREILDGVHGEPPPGHERLVLGHELLGRVKDTGRARRRHRPPPRPGALRVLREGRVGHVPERRVHGAWHQGARRLRSRARDDRGGLRDPGARRGRARSESSPSRRASSPKLGSRWSGSARAPAPPTSASCTSLVPGRSACSRR